MHMYITYTLRVYNMYIVCISFLDVLYNLFFKMYLHRDRNWLRFNTWNLIHAGVSWEPERTG